MEQKVKRQLGHAGLSDFASKMDTVSKIDTVSKMDVTDRASMEFGDTISMNS